MKTKSRAEQDKEILTSVKKEMDRPRLSASVRDDLEARAAQVVKKQSVHPIQA
jgi:hypothetical protein